MVQLPFKKDDAANGGGLFDSLGAWSDGRLQWFRRITSDMNCSPSWAAQPRKGILMSWSIQGNCAAPFLAEVRGQLLAAMPCKPSSRWAIRWFSTALTGQE